ncbi:NADPH HC-toxin reductase 1 isoform X2 [Ziziphus jujuba]|uniref:NADPH HC-toxin reductase 1 isoform X2 n=1 Tax=Ziziphus jujuba TaxID=326968 RepID=A0ABM3I4S1_ZIZJJ|nr:NADPH HC-toxin reductase 1 isoform X2 [Ziziphus jujuba]
MEKTKENHRVCVTGASGFIGSWLVKRLLEKGHAVHATLRNLEDESKVGLLKSLPHADTKLSLFQADIYNPVDFDPAIKGCEFVFHVATPMLHNSQSSLILKNLQYKDTAEAAIAGVRSIADSCIRSQTVKRLIYTASCMSASPVTDDGVGTKSCVDESCWTPLNVSFTYLNDFLLESDGIVFWMFMKGYTRSKTLAEKETLSYNEVDNGKLEVVTIPCGVVGGDQTLLPYLNSTVETLLSQLSGNLSGYNSLKCVQEITGSIPLVHLEDVCEAHIFCMEQPSLRGRYFCSVVNPTLKEIALYVQENYPEYKIAEEGGAEKGIVHDFTKLTNMGFVYKYRMEKILDDCIRYGKRFGAL